MAAKGRDPLLTSHGRPRQRWPAPVTPAGRELREDWIAFRLSSALRQQIAACADHDRLTVSSWLERIVRQEVERRDV